MKKPIVLLMLGLGLGAAPRAAETNNPFLPPPGLSGSRNEMIESCADKPALADFARNGVWVENGMEVLLLDSQIPIAPAPHIPWARPWHKPPKILIIHAYAFADTLQTAQVVRELDCDARWVLINPFTVQHDWGKDEAYRLGWLAEQARTALQEDYDAIVFALGGCSPGYCTGLITPIFPDDVYQTILDKVKAGTGLVLVGRGMFEKDGSSWINNTLLREAAPALTKGEFQWVNQPVLECPADGPFAGTATNLPPDIGLWVYQTNSPATRIAATASGVPLVYTGEYGNGRTVLCTYDGTLGTVLSMNQNRGVPRQTGTPQQYEHGLALAIRAILYAARAEPTVRVLPQPAQSPAGQPINVTVELSAAATLECAVRDDQNNVHATAKQKVATGTQTVTLPALPAGHYWVDLLAANRGWGSAPLTITAPQTMTLATDKDVYRVGDTVTISGQITGALPAQAHVGVQVFDATGRLLSEGKATGEPSQFTYVYPVKATVTAPHTAIVVLYSGAEPFLRQTLQFFVPPRGWDDYENILWPTNPMLESCEAMRDIGGITASMGGWYESTAERFGARVGWRGSRCNDGVVTPAEVQTQAPDPQTFRMQEFKMAVEIARRYGDLAFNLQDERGSYHEPPPPQAPALAAFRRYLQTQYGTVEQLNAQWESSFATWDDVQPKHMKDLTPEMRNLGPWLDFRLWMADHGYQLDKAKADYARSVLGPDTPVGIDGFTTSAHVIPYGGIDIGRLITTGVFNHYCPYGDDLMIAAMLQKRLVKFIGWYYSREEYLGNPWRDLFRGHWGTYRFMGRTLMSGFGWLLPPAAWVEEGTREIRGGCGKLLMHSERQFAPVAILYSYPSMIATAGERAWIEPGNAHLLTRPAVASRDAIENMLVKNGITFQYVMDTQLQDGALQGIKLLFIPHMMGVALSDEACVAIKQFVADGGYVVADMAPAVLDEHGKPRRGGGLDDLFGIERTDIAYGTRPTDYLVGIMQTDPWLPKGAWYVGEYFEKAIKVTDGQACGEHIFDKVPAFIVKNTGKGRALLLNFLNTVMIRRNGEPEKEDVALMARLLAGSGVTPYLTVPGCEVNVFRDHGAEYVGVYPYVGSSQSVPGDMQLATGAPAGGGAAGGPGVRLRFPEARETYDARTGTYLGKLKDVPLPVQQNAVLIARLDYRVTGVTLQSTQPDRQTVNLAIGVQATAKPGRHVVHLEVLEPDGKSSYFYTQNLEIFDGRGNTTLHLALNDKLGKWKITAREVVSGQTATTTVVVK